MAEQFNNSIKILFVCHGNICRSPMAEFVMKDMVKRDGMEDQFLIASAATSTEEIGNPVHRGTRNQLREHGIDPSGKRAVQLRRSDYEKYDFLIGMDQWNMRQMERILGKDEEGKDVYKRQPSSPWMCMDIPRPDANVPDIRHNDSDNCLARSCFYCLCVHREKQSCRNAPLPPS